MSAQAPESPSSAAAVRWTGLALLIALLLTFGATAGRDHANRDTYSVGVAAWVIATTGSPALNGLTGDSEFVGTDDLGPLEYHRDFAWRTSNTETGDEVIARAPGPVAATLPAAALVHVVTGSKRFSLAPEGLSAAVLSAFSALLLFLALVERIGRIRAILATGAYALTTPVWTISADAMWTHSVTGLGITGMAWAAARDRWWIVGLFGGVAVWGRFHTALIVAILGCGMAWARRRPGIAVRVALPAIAASALATLWTHWMYGHWSPAGAYPAETAARVGSGYGEGFLDAVTNQLGMWISPDRGILIWTPVLLLLIPAVVRGWHQVPTWARLLPLGGLVYTLAQAQLNTFTGGDGFYGYRHGLEFLATVTPLVALAVPGNLGRVSSKLLAPVLAVQFTAFMVGALAEGWYLVFTKAWQDNSFALALREEPLVVMLLALMIVFSVLVPEAIRQRRASVSTAES